MRILTILVFMSSVLNGTAQNRPIRLLQSNPHYFEYNRKPTVLITSGEHYGAVLNPDFNFEAYLKELRRNGLNMTRTMTGAYFEPAGAFNIQENTLGPMANKFICPFQRSETDNTPEKGKKFDLENWNPDYFLRLNAFMKEAKKQGVVVELSLFCPFYEDAQWLLSPFNSINNINNVGRITRNDPYTLDKNDGLLSIQEKMVRKIVEELKDYPNLLYEICNEPYFGGITLEWQERISKVITETEETFGYKHLITQNIANGYQKIDNPNSLISVFNFHYATPPVAVPLNYNLNKVIGDNETGFKGQKDSTYRKEAWEFIMAGGGLFNNLDYSFTVGHEQGTFRYHDKQPGGGNANYRKQLGFLKKFIESFQFEKMKPDSMVCSGGIPEGCKAYVLMEEGKQYAFYAINGKSISPEFILPAGNYSIEWLHPATGIHSKSITIKHKGGRLIVKSPATKDDIALRIKRV
ncbi:MAG: cellulase family glycosylhydrolase [Chitinophagaceae bacterium]